MNLSIRLTVNGAVKQDGNTSQFIFTPEEQIEYASTAHASRWRHVQLRDLRRRRSGHQHLLASGDLMETEIERLGKMRNRFVTEIA